jgi:iron complex outermembrane receptor protein
VGAKGVWLLRQDGSLRLRYDTAIYGLEVRNDIIPFDNGAYYMEAGKSRRAGVELGLELGTPFGLSSRFAGTVSHNRYIDYVNQLGDFSGNESAGIPPLELAVGARYDAPVGLYADGEVEVRGEYFADDANTARVPAFGVVDLRLGLRHRWGATWLDGFVGVDNALDERWVSSVYINGVNGRFYEPGMERNYVFGLSVRGQ